MAFGFPYPHYKMSRKFDLPQDELFEAVKLALKDLRWPYHVLWEKEFEARIPTTGWSWHHDFNVRFPSGGVVEAESRSAYQEMFFDFGRNHRNVVKFLEHLEQVTGRRSRDVH